jgi:LSD1 subclass zinc finger protein
MLKQILFHEEPRSALNYGVSIVTDTAATSDLSCANCGTPLKLPGKGVAGVTCPICQLFNPLTAHHLAPEITLDTLSAQLSDLVAQARASALPLDAIVHVLCDELSFAAELASGGRDLCVQIIDLGPRVGQPMRQSSQEDHMLLRGRTVGTSLR